MAMLMVIACFFAGYAPPRFYFTKDIERSARDLFTSHNPWPKKGPTRPDLGERVDRVFLFEMRPEAASPRHCLPLAAQSRNNRTSLEACRSVSEPAARSFFSVHTELRERLTQVGSDVVGVLSDFVTHETR